MSERVPNWPDTACSASEKSGGMVLRCTQRGCTSGKDGTRPFSRVLPAARIRVVAERDGWTIEKKFKGAACPACAAKEDDPSMSPANDTQRLGLRLAMRLIEEHYDDTAKCYETGWDDDRVAAEINMSPEFVARVRSDYFGPAEDPRIGDLREAIVRGRAEFLAELADIRQMADDVEAKWTARLDDLGRQLAAITRSA